MDTVLVTCSGCLMPIPGACLILLVADVALVPLAEPPQPSRPVVSSQTTQADVAATGGSERHPSVVQWRNGAPVLVWDNDRFTIRPLGQLIVDATTTTGAGGPQRNLVKTGVRAAHLGFAGTVSTAFVYQLETEFVSGSADILWAYIGWHGRVAGVGATVIAGNLQNDRGVEGSSGGEARPFTEANFVASAIAPEQGGFAFGAQARLLGPNWHASLAYTGNDVDARRSPNDDRAVLARVHWNPVKSTQHIVHLGGWGFDERFAGGARTLDPAANVGNGLNDATVLHLAPLVGASGDRGRGVELGGVVGPVWVMGEAGWRSLRLPEATAHSSAASISAGWFVTGGAPPYVAATGGFGRPTVKHAVMAGGPGEVELTARYQTIRMDMPDLRNAGSTLTGGVNWYLNGLMRLMVNASAWRLDTDRRPIGARSRRGTTLTLRGQIVF